MNASEAKQALERAVEKVGGTLEEDQTRRGMRCFQLCAPYGRVWSGNGAKHVRVDVDTRRERQPMEYNRSEVDFAAALLRHGHRTMTEQESHEADEEPTP